MRMYSQGIGVTENEETDTDASRLISLLTDRIDAFIDHLIAAGVDPANVSDTEYLDPVQGVQGISYAAVVKYRHTEKIPYHPDMFDK